MRSLALNIWYLIFAFAISAELFLVFLFSFFFSVCFSFSCSFSFVVLTVFCLLRGNLGGLCLQETRGVDALRLRLGARAGEHLST